MPAKLILRPFWQTLLAERKTRFTTIFVQEKHPWRRPRSPRISLIACKHELTHVRLAKLTSDVRLISCDHSVRSLTLARPGYEIDG